MAMPDQERLSEQARAEKYGFVLEALARLTGSLVVGHLRFGRDGAEALMEIRRDHSSLARQLTEAERALKFYADEENWTQPTSWGGRIHDDESAAIMDGGKIARAALDTAEPQGSALKDGSKSSSGEALDTGGSEG